MAFARPSQQQAGLTQLAVKGWASGPSKFAGDPASGLPSVIQFLERKSNCKVHSYKDIGKSHVLLIDVDENDVNRFYHLNGFNFAGATLTVEESKQSSHAHQNGHNPPSAPRSDNRFQTNTPNGPRSLSSRIEDAPSGPRSNQRHFSQPNDLINGAQRDGQGQPPSNQTDAKPVIIEIIKQRYNAQEKYLTLEALAADPLMQQSGLSSSSPARYFPAIFTICEKEIFETPAKRKEMVVSVSLSNNGLRTVQDVISLSATFPHLKNLDLSNNQISEVGDMRFWRNAFRSLEHLILTGNPIDAKPQAKQQLTRWYRNMRMMNNAPLAPNGAANMALDAGNDINRAPSPAQPLPTQSHPEFPEGSTFGVPQPGKSDDILLKEQMGLRFSFETRLKMQWVEQCLSANNFDYDKAMKNLQELVESGAVPADAFLTV